LPLFERWGDAAAIGSEDPMTANRILQLNAVSTLACALGLLATRAWLPAHFGLGSSGLLDALAVGLVVYAAALFAAAARPHVDRATLLAFTAGDVLWVVGSAAVLLLAWGSLSPLARVLVIAVALAVEVFATLQWRAAGQAGPAITA
jgi:hypothetical protein